MSSRTPPRPAAPPTSACFEVGRHRIEVSRSERGWHTGVDGIALTPIFFTQAEAWTAGIGEADRLDRTAASPRAAAAGKW